MRNETMIWQFETKNFRVIASIMPDDEVDTSFDETGETVEKLNSGEWQAFQTAVRVYFRDAEISADYLGGSIYANPRDFFTEHRSADPMNRNCSIMRAAQGDNVSMCHYFPGMVSEAISAARKAMSDIPQLRSVGV